jgi:hypothetical protein
LTTRRGELRVRWVRIAYVDEAADRYRYRIGAVLMRPEKVNATIRAIDEIAGDVEARLHVVAPEFHGYEVFQGQGPWAGVAPNERIHVYARMFECIAEAEAEIVLCGFDQDPPGRHNWDEGTHISLMTGLVVALDQHCLSCNEHVLVVADEHSTAARCQTLTRLLQEIYSTGTRRAVEPRDLRVIDSLHYVRSHDSRLVQASDLVAYLVRRAPRDGDPRRRQTHERLLRIVEPLIVGSWNWSYEEWTKAGKLPSDR